MIRFKCIYCGQKIVAKDDSRGKKGKCPKCQHLLVVPQTTKNRPAISSDKETATDNSKLSNKSELDYTQKWLKQQKQVDLEQEDVLIELYKESFGFLIPAYDKIAVLVMAVTFILLFMVNSTMRNWIREGWIQDFNADSIVLRIVFGIIPLFIATLFVPISVNIEVIDFKKMAMVVFVVFTNAIAAIAAGVYLLKDTSVSSWLLVFPIWSIISGFLLIALLRFGIIDEECIVERDVKPFEIILSLASALAIFVLCNYISKLYWAITYSICIVYTTSFDKAVQRIFLSPTNTEDQQAP